MSTILSPSSSLTAHTALTAGCATHFLNATSFYGGGNNRPENVFSALCPKLDPDRKHYYDEAAVW